MSVFTDHETTMRQTDQSLWLGQVAWYSVSDSTRIDHPALKQLLDDNGLGAFVPPVPRDDDVFRRVCSDAARKHVPTQTPEVFDNYLVRDVRRQDGRVWKNIVVESVDGSNRKLGYHAAIEIMFNSADSSITLDLLPEFDRGIDGYFDHTADQIAKWIVAEFTVQKGNVNSYAIRGLTRKVLETSQAICVREGGGVYFVIQDHALNLTSLQIIAQQIDGYEVHPLPLIDDGKQRDMLRRAFEAETVGEIDATLAEIEKIMAGPEITQKRYSEMVNRMNALREQTKSYEELLEEEQGNTQFRLKVFERKMAQLLNHVKF